jgi:hypothetical protein
VDPIGVSGESNLFNYTQSNPINSYDAFGLYPATPRHGTVISPERSVWLIKSLQENADKQLDFTIQEASSSFWYSFFMEPASLLSQARNLYRLHVITGLPYSFSVLGYAHPLSSGGGVLTHRQANKFVFTCKYGWIDHGHFFYNAYSTYRIGRGLTAVLAELNEIRQTINEDPSAYSPEDKTSNWLGRQFGKQMYVHDYIDHNYFSLPHQIVPASAYFDIAREWELFLKEAGAVKLEMIDELGIHVKDILESELDRYRDTGYSIGDMLGFGGTVSGNQLFKGLQPEWRCLCNGDIPRYEKITF